MVALILYCPAMVAAKPPEEERETSGDEKAKRVDRKRKKKEINQERYSQPDGASGPDVELPVESEKCI